MRKYIAVTMLVMVIIALSASDAFAGRRRSSAPAHYVNVSLFLFHPLSVGYKHRITRNVYLTGNMDYIDSDRELLFQGGAAYMIPEKFLIFRFYGGGGIEFSRNRGDMYPYAMIGTNFWILFTELVHPLQSGSAPSYRLGFSLSF